VTATAAQARALIALRITLWWRRMVQGRQWVRIAVGGMAALVGLLFSASLCILAWQSARQLGRSPETLRLRGGPLALFASWVTLALAGRAWFGIVAMAQGQAFLDPRRFRGFPVSQRLLSALNLVALLFDPVWLILYPPLIVIALAVAGLPEAPAAWAMLCAEIMAVFCTAGILHLAAAAAALLDARPLLRRGFSVLLLLAGIAGFQLSLSVPGQRGIETLFTADRWGLMRWSPPGWTAQAAQALSRGQLAAAFWSLLLLLSGLFASLAAHALSQRELSRPPEPVRVSVRAARTSGWKLPLAPGSMSALLEKEAKTAVRIGWLQLVIVPVAYLLLVHAVLPGPQPLLIAAVYAHLGVLEISTNAFGRDVDAARAWFLWPVTLRSVLFAKNAVAYLFSLAIFLMLALVAAFSSDLEAGQLLVGLLAHAAIFPLLATFGNAISVWFPVPVRGARLRRVRGTGPIGARLTAMLLLAGAAWAPYAIAQVTGVHLYAAYAGELVALLIAYPALLGAAARLAASRRESLLGALARDE